MAIALIGAGVSAESPDSNAFTSGNYNTTGASLALWTIADQIAGQPAFSDNQSNTYTNKNDGSDVTVDLLYKESPTVSATHTFSVTTSPNYSSLVAAAFSGVKTSAAAFDQENSNRHTGGTDQTIQPGSITPSENDELIITCLSWQSTATASIDSGFTIIAQTTFNGSFHYPVALAYKVQTTAAAVNPTWTLSAANQFMYTRIASFKAAPAGGAPARRRLSLLGVA